MSAASIGHDRLRRVPVYAIRFDLDTETLETLYSNESWRNADTDIRKFPEADGFEHKQGSVHVSTDEIDAVDWFTPCLKDIRMVRIEDNNDLMPALDRKRRAPKKR